MSPSEEHPPESRPPSHVVRGAPTDDELAAVIAVLTAVTAAAAETGAAPTAVSRWNDPGRSLRRPLSVGPHAWHTAFWPR